VCEELVQHGDLLHNVIAHLGDFGEEEESEETGYTTESGGESTESRDGADCDAVVVLRNGVFGTERALVGLVGAAHADSSGRLGMVGERCGRHLGLVWRAVAMLKCKSRVDKVEVARRCCAGAEAWQWEPTNEVSRDFAGGQHHPATLLCLSTDVGCMSWREYCNGMYV
jgi:hypothetical protein